MVHFFFSWILNVVLDFNKKTERMKIKRGKEGKIKKLRNRVPTVVLSGSDFFFASGTYM